MNNKKKKKKRKINNVRAAIIAASTFGRSHKFEDKRKKKNKYKEDY